MARTIALFVFLMLVMAGCGRKHIPSTSTRTPETTTEAAKADVRAPEAVAPSHDASGETATTTESEEAPTFTEKALTPEETVAEHEKTPVAESVKTLGEGLYYIQVGAFNDPEKAHTILAGLMSDGYSGSRMIKDGALLKVQAGGFADEASAREAKAAFADQYPGCFLTR